MIRMGLTNTGRLWVCPLPVDTRDRGAGRLIPALTADREGRAIRRPHHIPLIRHARQAGPGTYLTEYFRLMKWSYPINRYMIL